MTPFFEIIHKLNNEDRRKVRDFAEFLLTRRNTPSDAASSHASEPPIRYEGWLGCLAGVHPELSDADFEKLTMEEWVRAGED
jgi:hypothetical protein